MPKVTRLSLNGNNGSHFDILRSANFESEAAPSGVDLFQEDNVTSMLADSEASIVGSEPYSRKVIQALPKLRVISRSGVGFDAVDLLACDEAGVVVTTTPGVNHHSVAEHTIALLTGVARGFPGLDRQVRENRWSRVGRPRVMGISRSENGARHGATGPTLGSNRDDESDGTHSVNADHDDFNGGSNDENGVTFGTIRVGQLGAAVTVNVQNAPSGAKLDAIDCVFAKTHIG